MRDTPGTELTINLISEISQAVFLLMSIYIIYIYILYIINSCCLVSQRECSTAVKQEHSCSGRGKFFTEFRGTGNSTNFEL